MSDRVRADAVLEHVAVLAFLYYPGIEVDDPSYSLDEDIDWCLEPSATSSTRRGSA